MKFGAYPTGAFRTPVAVEALSTSCCSLRFRAGAKTTTCRRSDERVIGRVTILWTRNSSEAT